MPEELDSLLERIRSDGVETAEAEAERIIAEAKSRAEDIVKTAEKTSQAASVKSEKDAAAFMERAERSLEQVARDVILSVNDAVNNTLSAFVARQVTASLDPDTLKKMIVAVVEGYSRNPENKSRIEVLLNPAQHEQVAELFLAGFKEEARSGIEIKGDDSVVSGFRLSLVDEQVEHDFSGQAIAEAFCRLLRPHLGEIAKNSAKE